MIIKNAKRATSFMDRALGLLNPNSPRILILQTRFGIHTFFMKEKIDVLILDDKSRVVKIRENLSPFKLFFYNPKHSLVVEMPGGLIRKKGISINDKISFR